MDQPDLWPRWRLLSALGGLAVTALVLLAGLALAVFYLVAPAAGIPTPDRPALPTNPEQPALGDAARDAIAAAPMLHVAPEASRPTSPAAVTAPDLPVPAPTTTGPAGVATGFPRTPEGAVAQLAAIEVRVLEAMSVPVANQVHTAWVLPGGPPVGVWELTTNVQAFLAAAGQESNVRDETTFVQVLPAGGLVKGVDGPEWTLACVLVEVRATILSDARIGYGHCARMQWHQDRWLIAPGIPPAQAPSTWPASQAALDAGWRTWREESLA